MAGVSSSGLGSAPAAADAAAEVLRAALLKFDAAVTVAAAVCCSLMHVAVHKPFRRFQASPQLLLAAPVTDCVHGLSDLAGLSIANVLLAWTLHVKIWLTLAIATEQHPFVDSAL